MTRQEEKTVALLLDAARLAMRGVGGVAYSDSIDSDPARAVALLALWSAAAGEDIAAEIERIRNAGEPDEPPNPHWR